MIIDGKSMAASLKEEMKAKVETLAQKYSRRPSLSVILVGENPASQSYVRGKVKAAAFVGIEGNVLELPDDVAQDELLDIIARLNSDPSVDGILVQLPLPEHIDEHVVMNAVASDKDVDGFHPSNVCGLWRSTPSTVPCTPKGIMKMIAGTGTDIRGKRAVVVGRSNIVGKPVAKLLLDADATVTLAHSKTADLGAVCRDADILVVAAGSPGLVRADMVKPGAVVIDVGINRVPCVLEDGSRGTRIVGDVDFDEVSAVAGFISPVPGGVGPMTIATLMENTIECYERHMLINNADCL